MHPRSKWTGRRIDVFDPREERKLREGAILILIRFADAADEPFTPERWPGSGGDVDDVAWVAFVATDVESADKSRKMEALEAAARLRDGVRLDLQWSRWIE